MDTATPDSNLVEPVVQPQDSQITKKIVTDDKSTVSKIKNALRSPKYILLIIGVILGLSLIYRAERKTKIFFEPKVSTFYLK